MTRGSQSGTCGAARLLQDREITGRPQAQIEHGERFGAHLVTCCRHRKPDEVAADAGFGQRQTICASEIGLGGKDLG